MEKLISSWSDGKSLPENYVFPEGKRPGEHVVLTSHSIPVVDLGKAENQDHSKLVHQILEASELFGFFQVINHGVPRRLMEDARSVFQELFELPAEEKSRLCSSDDKKKCVLFTSNIGYDKEAVHYWREALRHSCSPLEECKQYWPEKPSGYREVVGEYVVKASELGSTISELICKGLKLEPGYLAKGMSQEPLLVVNHYPPCPDASLTIGNGEHIDPNLMTILLQGDVPGLQVYIDGEWLGVDPIPDAFVVNVGHQLEIVSNGKLKGVKHRAVTNATKARISAAFFVEATKDCLIEPAKAVISTENPPIYKGVRYGEILQSFKAAFMGHTESVVQHWKLI